MRSAAGEIQAANHHPRWENVYKDVKVSLTTLNIYNHLSDADFRIARFLENLYTQEYLPGKRLET